MALAVPETIGRFNIIQPIGEGGMGRLYLGRDPDIGRLAAIKLLREGFDDRELRERFSREAQAASALRHANIVTVFEAGVHDGRPYMAMEYIKGGTLADLVKQRAPLSFDRKLQLMDELCSGMYYAHRKQVIHRDIKPANIMVDEEGVLRILDFGIARLGDGGMTRFGAVMGTPNYMAPEQWAGEAVDGRADIFSTGAVFYELLSYERAFPGRDPVALMRRIVTGHPRPLGELCPDLDPGLAAIVNRCLAHEPADRYQDFGAVREALASVRERLAGAGSETLTAGVPVGDWADLPLIRVQQVERHVNAARQALESANYKSALRACQQALLLDPEQTEARRLGELARTAMEHERLMSEWLTGAKAELARGAVTAASVLLDRVLSMNPESTQALALRKTVDEARRRLAIERGRAPEVGGGPVRPRSALEAEGFERAFASVGSALKTDSQAAGRASLIDPRPVTPLVPPEPTPLPEPDTVGSAPRREGETGPARLRRHVPLVIGVSVAIAAIAAIAGIRLRNAGPPPLVQTTAVVFNLAPWAKIDAITRKNDGQAVNAQDLVTPCVVALEPGEYHVRASNPNYSALEFDLTVDSGDFQSVRYEMPGFDPRQEITAILAR